MPTHLGESFVNNLKTALEGIDGTPTYNNDLSTGTRVFLFGRHGSKVNDRPSIVITYAGETLTTEDPAIAGTYRRSMMLQLQLHLREGDATEASGVMWDMIHDVEVAVGADITRGGKACDTRVVEIDASLLEDALPDFDVIVTVEITYDTGTKDPSTLTPSVA